MTSTTQFFCCRRRRYCCCCSSASFCILLSHLLSHCLILPSFFFFFFFLVSTYNSLSMARIFSFLFSAHFSMYRYSTSFCSAASVRIFFFFFKNKLNALIATVSLLHTCVLHQYRCQQRARNESPVQIRSINWQDKSCSKTHWSRNVFFVDAQQINK